jgi:hypothetical protein
LRAEAHTRQLGLGIIARANALRTDMPKSNSEVGLQNGLPMTRRSINVRV